MRNSALTQPWRPFIFCALQHAPVLNLPGDYKACELYLGCPAPGQSVWRAGPPRWLCAEPRACRLGHTFLPSAPAHTGHTCTHSTTRRVPFQEWVLCSTMLCRSGRPCESRWEQMRSSETGMSVERHGTRLGRTVIPVGGDGRVGNHDGFQMEAPVRHEHDGICFGGDGWGGAAQHLPCSQSEAERLSA